MAFTVALNTDENNSHLVYSGGAGLEDSGTGTFHVVAESSISHSVFTFLPDFFTVLNMFSLCFFCHWNK